MKKRFDELQTYVRFDAADLDRLRRFHQVAHPHFGRISRDFYERIREHEDAHAVLHGEEQIKRLQQSLVRWMERVCTAKRDDAYVADTMKIGTVHVRIGLPQRFVFGAMALIHVAFEAIADEHFGAAASAVRASITRALDLELAIMLQTYHDDFDARLERLSALEAAGAAGPSVGKGRSYAHAVELAPYLVVGVDASGRIALFNEAAERASQLSRDQVMGQLFVDLLLADGGGAQASALAQLFVGQRSRLELDASPLRTRSGRIRLVDWSLAHNPSPEEEVVVFAMGRDVTDEVALAERTRQTEKLAALGTLAAGLAHEIRNPLNGAHLHVTFLERGLRKVGADAEALEAVRVVGDEITRLSELVTEFLDFARPKPLERQSVALRKVVERVAQLAAPQLEETHCTLELDLPATELFVDADKAKLEQVLLNLVRNGLEAMDPIGGGRLRLQSRRSPMHAVVEVEDQGPGIPDPGAPIFDAFYSTKPSGTGLGLAIVHRIVTDHGGTIAYESEPGCTVFRLTWPLFQSLSEGSNP